MITLNTEAIVKDKSPSQIFQWWINLNNNTYVDWHNEHLKWEWKKIDKTNGIKEGSKIFIREKINNIDFKFLGKLIKIEKDSFLSFKHSFLPLSFSFKFQKINNDTKVTWNMDAGFNGIIGKVLDPFLMIFFFSDTKKKLIYKHIAEEHQLLETLIK